VESLRGGKLKKTISLLLVVLALSGCKERVPPEAKFCAKALEIWFSSFSENLEVTGFTPPTRQSGDTIFVGIAGQNISSSKHVSARCELTPRDGSFHLSRRLITAEDGGLNMHEVDAPLNDGEDTLLRKEMPFLWGISFKIDGYSEESFGMQWFNH